MSKNYKLSPAEHTLLQKGLTFIPTWETNKLVMENLHIDLNNYHRKIKLAAYFEKTKHNKNRDQRPFTLKSTWTPSAGLVPGPINNIIGKDLQDLKKRFKIEKTGCNLTKAEIKGLKSLRKNNSIIIKPADKGSAIVIQDRFQYLWEGNRQLADKEYYLPLNKPLFPQTIPMVMKLIEQLYQKKYINMKQKKYLMGQTEPRPRRFYLLPKIHKDPRKWSKPFEIPSGRPIVSDCESETYFTAELIEHFLNPLSTRHPSYIRDTYDFIYKIQRLDLPSNTLLFTMDVNSLYTNIVTTEGMRAVKRAFLKHPDPKRPDEEILKLLFINLTRNDFEFNGKFYLQIKGTAMGKKFAPSYANIYMADWENEALKTVEKKPKHYFRFLDDIWGVWTHSVEEFWTFVRTLNNFNNSIQVTAEINAREINFLDTTTFKGPGFESTHLLDTKVYFKATDTHALLHKTSYHPKHTFKGLIKSQLLRFSKICSRQEDFLAATGVLFKVLTTRGYSRSFLRKALKEFRERKPVSESPLLPLVVNFSKSTSKFVRIIKSNFYKETQQTTILQDYRIITAFKRNKNLQDYLVTAQVKSCIKPPLKAIGVEFLYYSWIRNPHTKNIFKIEKNGGRRTHNCVYLIQCARCTKRYVGETGNNILTRFNQHKYNIKRYKNTHVWLNKHFIEHGWSAVRVIILEHNPHWSRAQRRTAERKWILRLGTIIPQGLNEKPKKKRILLNGKNSF